MARVFWDTNLFIYLLEENPSFLEPVADLRQRMRRRGDDLLTSWMTVGEILTKPRAVQNRQIEKSYLRFFQHHAIQLIPFGEGAAAPYAELRATHRLRPADAIQVACAAAAKADLFITNDERLASVAIPDVKFITSLSRVPI